MRRFLVKALAAAAALLALVCVILYASLRRSLPLVDGAVTVAGISAPIDIIRDADAIPHIFASTELDALYGLGYVHAQDRLWQMEFQRRIGHGRLSEIFGAATLPQDRFLRTVGFARAARTAWETMPEETETAGECVRRGRQRVPRGPSRQRAAAGVPDPPLRARALDRRRRRRLGEDDGVGPERELRVRIAAPRHRAGGRPGEARAVDAAVS